MKTYLKQPPFQSQRYIRDVKRVIRCVITGRIDCDFHHIKGLKRGSGGKDDRLGFPLIRELHVLFHNDPKAWEQRYGLQVDYCKETLEKARDKELLRPDLIDEALSMLPTGE